MRPLQDYSAPRPSYETSHRDSYYIIIFQQSGQNHLMVDFESVTLNGCCTYTIAPGQVHHFISSENTSGWILAAEPLTIDENYTDILERDYGSQKPIGIDMSKYSKIENCLKNLYEILSEASDAHFQQSLLSHMVSVCTGLFISLLPQTGAHQSPSRQVYLSQAFRKLLRLHFKHEKRPSGYAEHLNVSPGYLNECVKATTGRSVGYWIQQQAVLEAKKFLAYSKLDVKEIAYQLGYPDNTYFIRLFKKLTGNSPAAFRKNTAYCPAFT